MKIEAVDAHRLRMALDAQDMQALGLTYQALLSGQKETGRTLMKLLAAGERAGFCCKAEKLLIEVYPFEKGGCVLYFTGLQRTVRYRVKENGILPRLFWFQDADALCAACRAVYRQLSHRMLCSSLYGLENGGYILSVCPLDGPHSHILSLLYEFGEYKGQGRLLESIVREHAALLREDDAMEVLA